MTCFPVTALRSVEIGTPDLNRSERFYAETWGLDLAARTEDVAYLRATGPDHHVLALHRRVRREILSVTFRASSAADLTSIAAASLAQGATILSGPQPNDEPDSGIVLTMREPQGGILRFVHGDIGHADQAADGDKPTRLAHVNLNSTDVAAATRFYEQALGFRLTDRSRAMAFLRCNGDHHAVVLAEASVNGLNHIAFLMPGWEAVMRGSGRMIDAGFPIGWGVGRHGPGDNVFAYFIDPAGFVIEYTAEVLQVDGDYGMRGPESWVWPAGRTDQWGIAPPKTEVVKAAQTATAYGAQPVPAGDGAAKQDGAA